MFYCLILSRKREEKKGFDVEVVKEWRKNLEEHRSRLIKKGLSFADLRSVTSDFWRYLEQYVGAVAAKEGVVCGKGCGHCCSHYPSSLEPFELLHIYGELRARPDFAGKIQKMWPLVREFDHFFEKGVAAGLSDEAADDEALGKYFLQGRKCPMLGEGGSCGIYEIRPSSCRMYFSRQNPDYCQPSLFSDAQNGNYLVELPDEIEELLFRIGAFFEDLDLPDSFFKGVLVANSMEDFWDELGFYKNVE